MSRRSTFLFAVAIALAAGGCADFATTGANDNTLLLSSAFQTIPAGMSATSTSFDASADQGVPFFPEDLAGGTGLAADRGHHDGGMDHDHHHDGDAHHEDEDHHDGFGHGGMQGLLMGGGLGPDFIGGIGFGHDRGRGPFGVFHVPSDCTFDATMERVACPDRSDDGLTLSLSFQFKDADGNVQSAFDTASTDYVNVQTSVSGTRTRHDSAFATLSHSSDRTVEGLAPGSTERRINGTAEAHESVTGKRDSVTFTAVRDASDTTTNLVIPISDGRPTIPSAGTVIRNMSVSITPDGGTATTHSRREQVTFDGTNVVQVTITQDGVTKSCTITLPSHRLVCQ